MEPAENLIGEAVPTTLRGVEIQLWSMLVHSVDTQDAATLARTESVEACADHVDWLETHALNAIRGIRAISAKKSEERRVGQEGVSTGRSRGLPQPKKKKK